jgi:hypothetical protein
VLGRRGAVGQVERCVRAAELADPRVIRPRGRDFVVEDAAADHPLAAATDADPRAPPAATPEDAAVDRCSVTLERSLEDASLAVEPDRRAVVEPEGQLRDIEPMPPSQRRELGAGNREHEAVRRDRKLVSDERPDPRQHRCVSRELEDASTVRSLERRTVAIEQAAHEVPAQRLWAALQRQHELGIRRLAFGDSGAPEVVHERGAACSDRDRPVGRWPDLQIEVTSEHCKVLGIARQQLQPELGRASHLRQPAVRRDESEPVRAALLADRLEVRELTEHTFARCSDEIDRDALRHDVDAEGLVLAPALELIAHARSCAAVV